jgi:hypothetical protein
MGALGLGGAMSSRRCSIASGRPSRRVRGLGRDRRLVTSTIVCSPRLASRTLEERNVYREAAAMEQLTTPWLPVSSCRSMEDRRSSREEIS